MTRSYKHSDDIDPNDFISDSRQVELINMAHIYPFNAVRLAIREAVFTALTLEGESS